MLQLIIWMMCVYFVAKAVELVLIARNAPEEMAAGSKSRATITGLFLLLAAAVFFMLSLAQASQFTPPPSLY